MTRLEYLEWWDEEWPQCGCCSRDVWQLLLHVLECLERPAEAECAGWKQLWANVLPQGAVGEQYLAVLDKHDLIEHGSGIRCPWLTQKGELLLAAMREYGDPEGQDRVAAFEEAFK
jgi:hypothetical protein